MPSTIYNALLNQTDDPTTQRKSLRIKVVPIATNVNIVNLDNDRKYSVQHLMLTSTKASATDLIKMTTDGNTPVDTVAEEPGLENKILSPGDVKYPIRGTNQLQFGVMTTVGGAGEVMVEIAVIETMLAGHEA